MKIATRKRARFDANHTPHRTYHNAHYVVLIAICALLLAATVAFAYVLKHNANQEADSQLRTLIDIYASQVHERIAQTEQFLIGATQVVSAPKGNHLPSTTEVDRLHLVQIGTNAESIILVDRDGSVIDQTHGESRRLSSGVGKRAIEELTRSGGISTRIFEILDVPGDLRRRLYTARGLYTSNGTLIGALIARIDLTMGDSVDGFSPSDLLATAIVSEQSGSLLFRSPDPGALSFVRSYDNTTTRLLFKQRDGFASGLSPVDGVQRRFAFKRIDPKLPLVAVVSIPESTISHRWASALLVPALVMTTCIFLTACTLVLALRRAKTRARTCAGITLTQARIEALVSNYPSPLVVSDRLGTIKLTNARFGSFAGFDHGTHFVGEKLSHLLGEKTAPQLLHVLGEHKFIPNHRLSFESTLVDSGGQSSVALVHATSICEGDQACIVLQMREVVEVREESAKGSANYAFNPTIGLPNQRVLIDRLHASPMPTSQINPGRGVLLYVDIDHFENLTRTLSQSDSNQLLREAGERLRSIVREGDLVANIERDTFGVLLPHIKTPCDARSVAQRVLETFRRPFTLRDCSVIATVSIGMVPVDTPYRSAHELLDQALEATNMAKAEGRDRFRILNEEENQLAHRLLQVQQLCSQGFGNGEFWVAYQPVVDPKEGRVVRAEALARWSSSELGDVPPGHFIPAMEETGQIVALGEWVLAEACRAASRWSTLAANPVSVSVNVDATQLSHPSFVDAVFHSLSDAQLKPHLLELEIKEDVFASDDDTMREAIDALREIGVSICLDDFATSVGSLRGLTSFPLNTIKLDRSITRALEQSKPSAEQLVRALLQAANALHIEVVAEGVETSDQASRLVALGCKYLQGYYYGHATRPETLDAIITGVGGPTLLGAQMCHR